MEVDLLKFKSTEELIREKQGLEDFAAAATAEGIEPSDEVKSQILELRSELERRHAEDLRAEAPEQWIGSKLNDCSINSLLHEGKYAYVFRATNEKGEARVLRLAKPDVAVEHIHERKHTFAFRLSGNEAMPVMVSPRMVLAEQIKLLKQMEKVLPGCIESDGIEGGRPFYVMPYHDGQSLRELIELGSLPLDVYLVSIFQSLIDVMAAFEKSGVPYHGNLKPEHVVFSKGRIHLLSPGAFDETVVTTPEYYPYLKADDRLAVGIMLFECVCKMHPLAVTDNSELEARLAPQFHDFVQERIQRGMFALTGLLRFRTPSEVKPGIPTAAAEMLIKALRLGFDRTGRLVADPGFDSWQSMRDALSVLK